MVSQKSCPICHRSFVIGGRGGRRPSAIYCSRLCANRNPAKVYRGSHAPRPKKGRDTLHNEAWLRARYIDERLTLDQIAERANATKQSVWRHVHEFGIPIMSVSERMPRRQRPRSPIRGGLSPAEYQVLHDAQGGLCAACGEPETKAHRNGTVLRLAVDHDHDTGRVRALLCSRCNYSLGYARDDPAVLQQLIDYLARHST